MQPTLVDILILPVSLAVFGATAYLVLWARSRSEVRYFKGRWVGVVLLVMGLIAGMTSTWEMLNPSTGDFYRAGLFGAGKRVYYAHYIAPAIPGICLLIIWFLERILKRHIKDMDGF